MHASQHVLSITQKLLSSHIPTVSLTELLEDMPALQSITVFLFENQFSGNHIHGIRADIDIRDAFPPVHSIECANDVVIRYDHSHPAASTVV
jgi:hypothetical protein